MGNVVAIVGRPNVGKSTLFNRLIGSRQAIVNDEAGTTRDRQYGKVEWAGREFSVIDTGGWVVQSDDVFEEEINKPVIKKQSDEVMQKTITRLQALLNSEEFKQENKAVIRFLNILTILYRTNPEGFALATESLQGRTRVYFARDEGTLLMAGNHTKPKQIPDTPYWVITNTNSGRKMLMLEGAMQSMHLPEYLIDQVRSFFTAN